MTRYVIYTRAETEAETSDPQTGLLAQERIIAGFLETHPGQAAILGRFCDAGGKTGGEVGDGPAPQMRRALALCQSAAAMLLVARVDRLPLAELGLAPFFANPGLVLRVAALPDVAQDVLCLYARLQQQERACQDRPGAPCQRASRPATSPATNGCWTRSPRSSCRCAPAAPRCATWPRP